MHIGDYVTRNNTDDVGVIEYIERTFDADNGRMLIIKGRLGKILLSRRLIYQLTDNSNKATILSGNLEDAVRKVVADNAIDSIDKNRNIPNLVLGAKNNLVAEIEPKQTSYSNLMEYTDEILCEYDYASKVIFNRETSKLEFVVYEGENHSTENKVIFSTDFDNLNASDYTEDYTDYKNVALVGGSGEGVDRFYALVGSAKGLNRREIFVDADSINKTYRDDDGTEHSYSDAEYEAMLTEEGSQTLYQHFYTDNFNGELNVQLNQWKLGIDYDLGDRVICDDPEIGLTTEIRITEITEIQDENGYNVEIKFEV